MKVIKDIGQCIPEGFFFWAGVYKSHVRACLSLQDSLDMGELSYWEYVNAIILNYQGKYFIVLKDNT